MNNLRNTIERPAGWSSSPEGVARGYIETEKLTELWIHTGTNCNLACPNCLEGSKPGDNRLQRVTLEDIKPIVDEAKELDINQFSFTGGEPFSVKDMVKILEYTLERGNALVLTNGTAPLQQRIDEVSQLSNKLKSYPYQLKFRVSLDHYLPEEHDKSRGKGMYDSACTGIKMLLELGFDVSIARLITDEEKQLGKEEIENRYFTHLSERGIDRADFSFTAFPDFLPPGSSKDVPVITEDCMTRYQTEEQRKAYMCAFSRMAVKRNNEMGMYACTLVDDDENYNMGRTLKESISEKVRLGHHRCFSCFSMGASCSEM